VGVTAIRRPTIRITYDEMAARPIGRRDRPAPVQSAEMRPQHQVAYSTETGSVARPQEAPQYTKIDDEDSPAT